MNFVEVTVKLIENPREVFIDSERCVYRVNTLLPAAGAKKAPTPLEINRLGGKWAPDACQRQRR